MNEHLKIAADACHDLAVLPRRGPAYKRMREALKLAEGCCEQIAYLRDGDARWLPVAMLLEEAHQRSLKWVIGQKHEKLTRNGLQRWRIAEPRWKFLKLEENLRGLMLTIADLQTRRTERLSGPIVPEIPKAHRTTGRPVQVLSPGGIIIPDGIAA